MTLPRYGFDILRTIHTDVYWRPSSSLALRCVFGDDFVASGVLEPVSFDHNSHELFIL